MIPKSRHILQYVTGRVLHKPLDFRGNVLDFRRKPLGGWKNSLDFWLKGIDTFNGKVRGGAPNLQGVAQKVQRILPKVRAAVVLLVDIWQSGLVYYATNSSQQEV